MRADIAIVYTVTRLTMAVSPSFDRNGGSVLLSPGVRLHKYPFTKKVAVRLTHWDSYLGEYSSGSMRRYIVDEHNLTPVTAPVERVTVTISGYSRECVRINSKLIDVSDNSIVLMDDDKSIDSIHPIKR